MTAIQNNASATVKALFAIAMLLLMTNVYAQDRKIFGGSICQASTGNQDVNFRWRPSGMFNEINSGTRIVTCPLVRDDTVAGAINVFVSFRRSAVTDEPVVCTLFTGFPFLSMFVTETQQSMPGQFDGTLIFSSSATQAPNDPITLRCTVPAQSTISVIDLTE